MRKILYINIQRGAGVRLIGNLFLSILEKIKYLDIDEYKSNCLKQAKQFQIDNKYEFCLFNDVPFPVKNDENHTTTILLNKIREKNIPIISIAHNYGFYNPRVDYQFVLNGNSKLCKNFFSINFVSGNIWENYNKRRFDKNRFLIPIRLDKIDFDVLKNLKEKNPSFEFDAYCLTHGKKSQDIIDKYKDVFTYKGYVTLNKMVDKYNEYSNVLIPSKSECLCMPIREGLQCGCDVYVYLKEHINNYAQVLSNYIYYLNRQGDIIHTPTKYSDDFNNVFNMENMILQFLFYLRGLFNINLYFDKNHKNNITCLAEDEIKNPVCYKGNSFIINKLQL